jgi:tetratricopeptide (TPR) repeat protein
MSGRSVINGMRLHQAPLVTVALLLLTMIAVATWLSGAWLCGAAVLVAMVVLAAWSARGLRLAYQTGMALRYYQDGHHEHADQALSRLWPNAQWLAANDPRRPVLLGFWAAVKRAQGDYTATESLYREAAALQQKGWGPEHPHTLGTLARLADAYIDIARFADAQPLIEGVLAVQQARAPRSRDVAETLHQRARLEIERQAYAAAEPFARQAVEVVTGTRPDRRDWLWWMCRLQLAQITIERDRLGEAETLLQSTLLDGEPLLGAEHPRVGQGLHVQALLRFHQGRLAEAEELQRRAVGILGRRLRGDHPALAPGLGQLARILVEQQRYEEAETFLRHALELREEYLAPEHPALAASLEAYADLLERTDRGDLAHPYRHRAEQIRAYHVNGAAARPQPGG